MSWKKSQTQHNTNTTSTSVHPMDWMMGFELDDVLGECTEIASNAQKNNPP
jgi:hypothetical protein